MKHIFKNFINKIKDFDESAKQKKKVSPMDKLFYIVPILLLVCAGSFVILSASLDKSETVTISDKLYNEYSNENTFKNRVMGEDQTPNKENNPTPENEPLAITVYGDSFCISSDSRTPSFPAYLSKFTNMTLVYNVANYFDNIEMMAAREGGVPMYISPCDIPEKKGKVEITLENEYGTNLVPDLSKNAGLNPCIVNDVEGVISVDDDTLYFTRNRTGFENIIATPTTVKTRAMDCRLNDVTIFFVGSDELYTNKERTIEIYHKMIDNLKTDKYLIMGPVSGKPEEIKKGNEYLEEEFGDKFINIYNYLCEMAPDDSEISFTSKDKQAIEDNTSLPADYLSKDTDFFSERANILVGQKIAEVLKSLKYL